MATLNQSAPVDGLGLHAASGYDPAHQSVVPFQTAPALPDSTNLWSAPIASAIRDWLTNVGATVAQFHNADNQSLPNTAYGLLAGGVAQLLNLLGNLDRQRETGQDGIPAAGIATGAAQFAMAFQTSDSTDNFTAGTRIFTPVAMSGSLQGVPWSIQVGSVLVLDTAANAEPVLVTAVTATTFTCLTTKTHNGTGTPFAITGFVYNQERDAAGELDGASGRGTAVAAEYGYNGGGPGNANFDRARFIQGKVPSTITINSGGGVASSSTTLASAPAGLQPGQPVLINGGTQEIVYTALNYVAGANPVLWATPIQQASHTSVTFDTFGAIGPSLSGMTPVGIGVEEDVVWDPVSNLFYIERSATQDAASGQNLPMEALGLYIGGGNFDRQRGPNVFKTIAAVAVTQGTPVAVWTPAGGKKFRVMGFMLSSSVAGSVILKDGAATEIIRTPLMGAAVGLASPPMGNGYLSTTANNTLQVDVTATGTVSGFVYGIEE